MTLHRLTITIPGPAMGAVRQTQADRWKQRPAVLAYRAWCDLARACAGVVPPAECVEEIRITAYYVPPESWSKRQRAAAIGGKMRTKPDWDNIGKAVCDALWKQDEALGDAVVKRRWDWTARLVLEIDYRK
jgi:Holliday junction resolvase RusA-like endonuclease